MSQLDYRPDIDGLRAVAVLLVLLFHVGLGCPGGFIGVDVFLVISGYLITRIVRNQTQTETFRLFGFWGRRIRRLVPAATLVVAMTLLAGCVFLLPSDCEALARSAIAQQLVIANIFFWQESGYFAKAAEFKPLLHTWSLAVEEQFYLGYPILLVLLQRYSARTTAILLSLLAVASLGGCELLMQWQPAAAFYLLPTRAWELLLGGIVSLAPMPQRLRPWQAELLSWLGLAAIVAAAVGFRASMHFPGMSALVPCMGACLVIFANSAELTFSGKILALRPLVFVGLISYSLYLWHWPVIVFVRFGLGGVLPVAAAVSVLLISFGLAYLSWRFVEQPFRKQRQGPGVARTYTKLACSAVGVFALALAAITSSGFSRRVPAYAPAVQAQALQGPEAHAEGDLIKELPMVGDLTAGTSRPEFIVWGDSHAGVLAEVCDSMATRHGVSGVFSTKGGFVPLLGVWRPMRPELNIAQWNQMVLDYIQREQIPNVILIAAWSVYTEGPAGNQIRDSHSRPGSNSEARAAFARAARRTIDQLEALGVRVWIIGQCPDYADRAVPVPMNMLDLWLGLPSGRHMSIDEHQHRQTHIEDVFSRVVGARVTYLAPTPACFDAAGKSLVSDEAGFFYIDRNHVSQHGAQRFFSETLDEVFSCVAHGRYEPQTKLLHAAERRTEKLQRH